MSNRKQNTDVQFKLTGQTIKEYVSVVVYKNNAISKFTTKINFGNKLMSLIWKTIDCKCLITVFDIYQVLCI